MNISTQAGYFCPLVCFKSRVRCLFAEAVVFLFSTFLFDCVFDGEGSCYYGCYDLIHFKNSFDIHLLMVADYWEQRSFPAVTV